MKVNVELLKKITSIQRCAVVALFFLGAIIVCQLFDKQQLAEKFAVLLYYALCLATLLALTEERRMKQLYYRSPKLHHARNSILQQLLVPTANYVYRMVVLSLSRCGTRFAWWCLSVFSLSLYKLPLSLLCWLAIGLYSYDKYVSIYTAERADSIAFSIPAIRLSVLQTSLLYAVLLTLYIYFLLTLPHDDNAVTKSS